MDVTKFDDYWHDRFPYMELRNIEEITAFIERFKGHNRGHDRKMYTPVNENFKMFGGSDVLRYFRTINRKTIKDEKNT